MAQALRETDKEVRTLEDVKGRINDLPLNKVKPLTVSTQWTIRARCAQKAGKLLNRFYSCAMGTTEMSSQQIRAGEAFLKVAMPSVSYSESDIRIEDTTPTTRSGLEQRAQQLIAQTLEDNPAALLQILKAHPEIMKSIPDTLRQHAEDVESTIADSEALEND